MDERLWGGWHHFRHESQTVLPCMELDCAIYTKPCGGSEVEPITSEGAMGGMVPQQMQAFPGLLRSHVVGHTFH